MKTIFITGTAGSGKSLLTSRMHEHHTKSGVFSAVLNLDPGVESLPYACDVDVRDHIDIVSIMKQYELGPNGALVMASDLLASKIDDVWQQIEEINPDYLLVDTPGQIELFAYRASGQFLVQNLGREEKMNIFLFDGALISTPANFVSMGLLAASIRLRLNLPTVNVLTKTDVIGERTSDILRWSADQSSLEDAISKQVDGEAYSMAMGILRGLDSAGLASDLIPVSNVTGEGMVNLESASSRIINLGEEIED